MMGTTGTLWTGCAPAEHLTWRTGRGGGGQGVSARFAFASKRAAPNPNPSPYGLRKSALTGRCICCARLLTAPGRGVATSKRRKGGVFALG